MINIVLDHVTYEPFYCPFCGKTTIPHKKPFNVNKNICEHLLYLGTTEGGFEFCKTEIKPLLEDFDESIDEEELIKLDISNSIHFSLCEPAPSSFGVFIGYVKYVDVINKNN